MMLPYGRHDVTDADIDAVVQVLRSDFLTQGPAVPSFEQRVAAYVGANHAVAVNSATAALHLACMALELGRGDVLWTTPNTFVASANCARYCGADVDFVDIDPVSWNISVPALKAKLERAAVERRLPKIVVPVHFSGQATDQEHIHALSLEFGFRVIEDASHAIGASRNGERVGSCRWSDITVFSFHPVKIITTGEGGVALTNDSRLASRLSMLRSHGITREVSQFVGDSDGLWYYEQQLLGYNYRMTDIQAALGSSQMGRLDAFVQRRSELAQRYDVLLEKFPLQLPTVCVGNRSAWHLYVVRVQRKQAGVSRRQLFEGLRARDIGVNVHYMPVHLQPYYRAMGFAAGQFPQAELYGDEAITLPLFASMSNSQQDTVVRALEDILGQH